MVDGLPESVNVQLNREEIRAAIEYCVAKLGHTPTSAARYLMSEGAKALGADGRIPVKAGVKS